MNHVNLIGKISQNPTIVETSDGRKIAHFGLTTSENYLDAQGNLRKRSMWHRISAWGNWVAVLEQFGEKGTNMAVEGRLISRFYKTPEGERKVITEVEVNDLILL